MGETSRPRRTRQAAVGLLALGAFAALSFVIFRGYLTPEMMVYFLSFKWCF
jgi:MYXO-CTERM domain-containing protein